LRQGEGVMSDEEIKLQTQGKRYTFNSALTNNYISREDMVEPLKSKPYFLGGPRGVSFEIESELVTKNELFLNFNTAELVD
jgi:hypothetical protein